MPALASSRPRDVQLTLGRLRAHMARYGYVPADVPILQSTDLFLTRAGDQILHKLFTFERHGTSLALRPEFTSPALRRYMDEFPDNVHPIVRWQFAGIIFEEDPASNRIDYERVSSGAECIGMAGPGVEAEIIAMSVEGCGALGINAAQIVLGNMQLVRRLLSTHAIDSRTQQFVLAHLPALVDPARGLDYILERFETLLLAPGFPVAVSAEQDAQNAFELVLESTERGLTMGGRTQADIARRLIQKHRRAAQREPLSSVLHALQDLAQIDGDPAAAFTALRHGIGAQDAQILRIIDDWQAVPDLLLHYGVSPAQLRIKPILARDWEYYSGLVFEIYAEDYSGIRRHVAGGGRYDELARLLGAEVDIPAVGFVYYLSELLASDRAQAPSRGAWTLVSANTHPDAVHWAQALRLRGVSLELSPAASPSANSLSLEGASLCFAGIFYEISQIDDLVAHLNESVQ